MAATSISAYRTETLLSVENVSLVLEGRQILRDISIKVDNLQRHGCVNGQVVALLGPSGVGKSVFLRILAGLLRPTSGAVYLTDKRLPVAPGAVGMVMQDNPLFRHRTVIDNLMLAARQHGYDSKQADGKAREMLTRFGMADTALVYPAQLSGGMRQRVAIIQQLICSERFLLMDEPFAALDPVNVTRVCDFISEVANQHEHNTVIAVTHNIEAALSIADTLWILGRPKPGTGATIVDEYDLVARGLCWRPDVDQEPVFLETEREIRARFNTL